MKRLCFLLAAFLPVLSVNADTGTWRCYSPGNQINNIDIAGDHIWCATSGSLVRWNVRDITYTQYTTLDGLLDPETNLVSACPSGGAWVSYSRVNGASRFDGFSWTHFDKERGGLPAQTVRSLHVDSKGRAWLGYDSSGIFMYDGMSWTHFTHDAVFSAAPLHVAVGLDGTKWVSTRAGAVAVSNSGHRVYTADDGLAGNTVRMTGIAPDGAVWFCTSTGVSRLRNNACTTWKKEDGLASSNVFSLAFAPDGAVWFATDRGVSRFNDAKWTSYTDTDGLIAKNRTPSQSTAQAAYGYVIQTKRSVYRASKTGHGHGIPHGIPASRGTVCTTYVRRPTARYGSQPTPGSRGSTERRGHHGPHTTASHRTVSVRLRSIPAGVSGSCITKMSGKA